MNRKGFTLVELLGVIVVLSIVLSIASAGVISIINNSKNRSEKIFVDKIKGLIDDYIAIKGSSLQSDGTPQEFKKCQNSDCSKSIEKEATKLQSIHLRDLVTESLIEENQLINPSNKKKCLENGKNPEIEIYKDTDYVYYYYVDLRDNNTSCEIKNENAIINTLPDDLKSKVGK